MNSGSAQQPKVEPDDKVTHPCGASSSRNLGLHLLPYQGTRALAQRFLLGEQKHGHDNWRKGLDDKAYLIERAGHIIDHALKLIAKLEGHLPEDGDDDAGAIAWGGVFLAEAQAQAKLKASVVYPNCSACGGSGFVEVRSDAADRTCPACKGSGKSKVR